MKSNSAPRKRTFTVRCHFLQASWSPEPVLKNGVHASWLDTGFPASIRSVKSWYKPVATSTVTTNFRYNERTFKIVWRALFGIEVKKLLVQHIMLVLSASPVTAQALCVGMESAMFSLQFRRYITRSRLPPWKIFPAMSSPILRC